MYAYYILTVKRHNGEISNYYSHIFRDKIWVFTSVGEHSYARTKALRAVRRLY